jgi:cell wall-associated NlpC family hydrolase
MATAIVAAGLWAAPMAAAAQNTVAVPGAGTAGAEASLQLEAQQLAGEIQTEGRDLGRLAEAVDAAQLHSQQLQTQLGVLQVAMVRTDGQVKVARADLREQALLSYLAGGAPIVTYSPSHPGSDPSLTVSYANIVSDGQRRAVDAYRAVLASQTRQSKQLTVDHRQAVASLAALQADRVQAGAEVAARQETLAGVQGQLATLVSQVQTTRQQAEQASVKANLASRDDLPAAASATLPSSQPRVAPSSGTGRASSPARTPVAPTPRSPRSAAPPITAPRPAPTTPPTVPTTAPPVRTTIPVQTTPPTSPPTTVPPTPPGGNVAAPGAGLAIHYAYAQLGKPYQWAGAGPSSFDCSGLTMMAWATAGVYFPHLAQAQYEMTRRISLADALPGDLIFFGTPGDVSHVGLYIGGGEMIDAPSTGLTVSVSSIYWDDLLGAGRVVT